MVKNEILVWSQVEDDPHCLRLCEVFLEGDICYMVMEKCQYRLIHYLEEMDEINERSLGAVFLQMLSGIAYLHSVGVVHRDIKPDNFLVGGSDSQTVKICDFGLSGIMPKDGQLVGICGTSPFMCPEMLLNRSCDTKADIWSFGVSVYLLFFGEFPYSPPDSSSQPSASDMKQAILDGKTPKFRPSCCLLDPDVLTLSRYAVEFSMALLTREPIERPNAMEALNLTYVVLASESRHMNDEEVPSLRPMLHSMKSVGACETRSRCRADWLDTLLNQRQMEKHGIPIKSCRGSKDYHMSRSARRNQDGNPCLLTHRSRTITSEAIGKSTTSGDPQSTCFAGFGLILERTPS